jgi:hypothetical protein
MTPAMRQAAKAAAKAFECMNVLQVRLKPDTTSTGPAEAGHYEYRSG